MHDGPTPTVEACRICGGHLWRRRVWSEVTESVVDVDGCPTCDRPKCPLCRSPFGLLFARHVRLRHDDDGGRCRACLS
jgi:hypothetical protein